MDRAIPPPTRLDRDGNDRDESKFGDALLESPQGQRLLQVGPVVPCSQSSPSLWPVSCPPLLVHVRSSPCICRFSHSLNTSDIFFLYHCSGHSHPCDDAPDRPVLQGASGVNETIKNWSPATSAMRVRARLSLFLPTPNPRSLPFLPFLRPLPALRTLTHRAKPSRVPGSGGWGQGTQKVATDVSAVDRGGGGG